MSLRIDNTLMLLQLVLTLTHWIKQQYLLEDHPSTWTNSIWSRVCLKTIETVLPIITVCKATQSTITNIVCIKTLMLWIIPCFLIGKVKTMGMEDVKSRSSHLSRHSVGMLSSFSSSRISVFTLLLTNHQEMIVQYCTKTYST